MSDDSDESSSDSTDLTSTNFNPLKALYSDSVKLPFPKAPILDNLTKFIATEDGVIVKIKPVKKVSTILVKFTIVKKHVFNVIMLNSLYIVRQTLVLLGYVLLGIELIVKTHKTWFFHTQAYGIVSFWDFFKQEKIKMYKKLVAEIQNIQFQDTY